MAVEMHYVTVAPFTVDASGNRIDKNDATTSINALRSTRLEHLIIPDSGVPNSADYPNLKTYLDLEADDAFVLYHLDQSIVITYKITA
jgi:hypothetical protein